MNEWLATEGAVTGWRRVVHRDRRTVLISKFEPGFAANLYDILDLLPELMSIAAVRTAYERQLDGSSTVMCAEAWRRATGSLLRSLATLRGIPEADQAAVEAGLDSVAALLDAVLWHPAAVVRAAGPSNAETAAYGEAVARIDGSSSIFTRQYGLFDGAQVLNHCPGSAVARKLFSQAWNVCTNSPGAPGQAV